MSYGLHAYVAAWISDRNGTHGDYGEIEIVPSFILSFLFLLPSALLDQSFLA
jgi:hypothetical protein